MNKTFTIAAFAAEVDPFSKAGGVGDVSRSLSKALVRLGHDVTLITPLYGTIDTKKHKIRKIISDIPVVIDQKTTKRVHFWRGILTDNLPVYFVDSPEYFSNRKTIYSKSHSENRRFMLFNLAALRLLTLLKITPDIIHCHEWHAGLVPWYLKKRFSSTTNLKKTATVFTIHNLVFQMGGNWWDVPIEKKDDGRSPLPPFMSTDTQNINFAKRAIMHADIINTVSEQYAQEILTKEFGQHLHTILMHRKDRVEGIVNGIDYYDFNPSTDPGLIQRYDLDSFNAKIRNKRHLQREFNLPTDPVVPVIGMASRMTEQKGFELVMDILEPLMRMDIQIVAVGSGDHRYESWWRKAVKRFPKKIGVHLHFDAKKASQIYAGSDMFLMPSRFEPCGLGQLISLRYGSVPIVHSVGGLADTITNYNPVTGKGNGFVFKTYDSRDLLVAITRATDVFRIKDLWLPLVRHGMSQSFSWEIPAKKYVTLFRRAVRYHRKDTKQKSRRSC